MKSIDARIDNAITQTVCRFPYFAPGILSYIIEESREIKTASTNGVRARFNPDWFATKSQEERVFVVLHEWFHTMFRHHLRFKPEYQPARWQRAMDFEVNGALHEVEGLTMPADALYDPQYARLTAEQIYAQLPEEEEEEEQNADPQSGHGEVEPFEGAPDNDGTSDAKAEEERIEQLTMAGLQTGRLQGKLPQALDRLLTELIEPAVDWKSATAEFISTAARNDYTFLRPNSRYAASGFILPSMYSEQLGSLVIVGDTSGSIDRKMLQTIGAEIQATAEELNFEELLVIWVDNKVQSVQRFQKGIDLNLRPKGGGGTSFKPAFKYLEDEAVNVAGLIYLTDGWSNSFAEEPEYPVLWAIIDGDKYFKPPYGRVLQIKYEGAER
jgi:predicted metal-dependent peptidase